MKILYQLPSLYTTNAGRTIYYGYKHAFEDMGHTFRPLTADDNPDEVLKEFMPDILFTSLNFYYLKYLSPDIIEKYKKKGVKVFANIAFWKSSLSKLRISEVPSMSENKEYIKLISSGKYADCFYNIIEQGDARMDGFQKTTGYPYYTLLLAADKTIPYPVFSDRFSADISFIGTFLPEKRPFFKKYVFPLRKKYNLKLYGQDWTKLDTTLNIIQKIGQYYNVPGLRSFKKSQLTLEQERQVYISSLVSINVHEEYQKRDKGDINERTFKIPISGGFEVVDEEPSLPKYFKNGKELVIAKNADDWVEKIEYYLKYPEKRLPIIEAGKKRVLKYHTYHNRVKQVIDIYRRL